ncbi:MAG TPA: hypothetical protein PLH83_12335 [Ruminococcus sp.]|nr:hypothetical protein [Ruminococcus sp.]
MLNYPGKPLFPYATGYYAIFPAGLKRDVGKGSIHETKDYIIYFKPDTPEEIKQRLIKDYAEYFNQHGFDD